MLREPPLALRPGLSTKAKITPATRNSVLAIPIQALTIRTKAQLEQQKSSSGSVHAAGPSPTALKNAKKDDEIQGVFVVRNRKAEFVPVTSGGTGTTDIERLDGLQERDDILRGTSKVCP